MVFKVYISGMSGSKEVKKRQQRVLMILDSKHIKYELVDITEPGKESLREFMQANSKSKGATISDPDPRHALPPQMFNDEEYCGDYDAFDLNNEIDTLEQFCKLAPAEMSATSTAAIELSKSTAAKLQTENGKVEETETPVVVGGDADEADVVKEVVDENKENTTAVANEKDNELNEETSISFQKEEHQNGDEILKDDVVLDAEPVEEKIVLKEAIDVAAAKVQESQEYSTELNQQTEHILDTDTREDETRPEDENEVVVPENKEIDEKEVKSASNDTETDAPNITTNPPQEQEDEKPLLENGDSDEDDDDEENGEQQNNGITGNGDASVDKNIDDEPGFDFNEEENSDETATTQSKLTDSERIIESEKLAAEQ